jgi:hypothetical protein
MAKSQRGEGVNYIYSIAEQLSGAFEKSGIEYMLVGSLASGLHGHPRMTNDMDWVVRMRVDQVPVLVNALGPEFDVDEIALCEAIKTRRSWSIFHVPTAFRIDLFMLKDNEYDVEAFFRKVKKELSPGLVIHIQSAEDTVLKKLQSYQLGNGQMNIQLRDVADVLGVQDGLISTVYLERWAKRLGVYELLKQVQASDTGASS